MARESQDQNARYHLLPRDFSHFQVQQKGRLYHKGAVHGTGKAGRQQTFRESVTHRLRTAQFKAHGSVSPAHLLAFTLAWGLSKESSLTLHASPQAPAPTSTLCPLFWRYTEPQGQSFPHQTSPDLTAQSKGFPADPVAQCRGDVGSTPWLGNQDPHVIQFWPLVTWLGTYFPCFCPKHTMVKTYLPPHFWRNRAPQHRSGSQVLMTW